jgi:hypothetical protein
MHARKHIHARRMHERVTEVRAQRRMIKDNMGSVGVQLMREKAKKQYENTRYDQPYQQALYNVSVLLELRRWHVQEYAAVVLDLEPADLEVRGTEPGQGTGLSASLFLPFL